MLRLPPQPSVVLAEIAEGDGFCVEVIPPPAGPGHDRCFSSYLDARAYARLLRFGNGWEIVDRVDPKTRKAADEAEQRRLEGLRRG
jgi:hypothetical protein